MADLVAALPASQRDEAELLVAGVTVFERAHPLTGVMSAAFGWTDEVTDEFWRYANQL